MKLATVEADDKVRYGIVDDNGFFDLSSRLPDCEDLRTLLSRGLLDQARLLSRTRQVDFTLDEVEFLPPNPRADMRMFALGLSYKAHQEEGGAAAPEFPLVFSKHPQSLVGHGRPLTRPRASTLYDFEGEIAIVIGKAGRAIPADRAHEHIAAYSLVMDGSVRDFQHHSLLAGKNFDASGAFGPWLITSDEIDDPAKIVLTTRLNGMVVQHCEFGDLLWDVGYLVQYLSTITRLEPGDVISTGTPAGVGIVRRPPLLMKDGDVIEVEASGIGTLRNTVVDEI
ncbi:fumarylacetoacetate hydrolase family protein [Cupriavidus necator]